MLRGQDTSIQAVSNPVVYRCCWSTAECLSRSAVSGMPLARCCRQLHSAKRLGIQTSWRPWMRKLQVQQEDRRLHVSNEIESVAHFQSAVNQLDIPNKVQRVTE